MICFFIVVAAILAAMVHGLAIVLEDALWDCEWFHKARYKLHALPHILSTVTILVVARAIAWVAQQAQIGG